MNKKIAIILATMLISACSQTYEKSTPMSVLQQLPGLWTTSIGTGDIRFYEDETVKLTFPTRTPPLKLISQYQDVKENTIGIALGGFWSGPVLIDTSDINNNIISVRFPDEEPVTFHRSQ